eukprot:7626282-Prorocentrum_lima.AAC.1
MTSSLVGSEMCIRDSKRITGKGAAISLCRSTSEALDQGTTSASHLATPVSYTHLTLPTICSV